MRNCLKPASLLLVCVFIAGCSTSMPAPTGPRLHPLEQNAINAMNRASHPDALIALDAALARYRSLDDIEGQWRIHLMKTRVALAAGMQTLAETEVREAAALAELLDSPRIAYETHLMLGRVGIDADGFRVALSHATTPLQQAVAHAYLGNTTVALELLSPDAFDNPANRAFVYYQAASAARSEALFQRALTFYRYAQDSRGIADSLVSIAKIAADKGNLDDARSYGSRAAIVLLAAGDEPRAGAVRDWLNSL